jgi:pyruvate dehydrogenase E2 component (dihydrolipoamide acetyltransferase)
LGALRDNPVVHEGQIVIQRQLTITATIDHRFVDGAQLATLAKCLRGILENPWQLDGKTSDAVAGPGAPENRS